MVAFQPRDQLPAHVGNGDRVVTLADGLRTAERTPGNPPVDQLANKVGPTIDPAGDSSAVRSLVTKLGPGAHTQPATKTLTRAIKFGVVGCSGVVVNLACTWAAYNFVFQTWHEINRKGAAFLSGIAVSILTNYLLNASWTWKERRSQSTRRRRQFAKFTTVAIAAAAIQFGIAMTLALMLGHAYLLAQTVGIGVASTLNFIANNAWTFRHQKHGDHQEHGETSGE